MIDAELVQERGLKVANVNRVAHDVVGELVRLAMRDAAFETAAGRPQREAARVMITAVVRGREFALRVDRASKFAAEDYDGFVEQPA